MHVCSPSWIFDSYLIWCCEIISQLCRPHVVLMSSLCRSRVVLMSSLCRPYVVLMSSLCRSRVSLVSPHVLRHRFSALIFHSFKLKSMPVKAIPKVSLATNGVGAYVAPCHRVTINYCNWGGSSKGVRDILTKGQLNRFAARKPFIVFDVKKREGHPSVQFHYNNDVVKDVEVKNLDASKVLEKIEEFSSRSGNPLFKFNHKVKSNNESVRGVWSPMHIHKDVRHRI